MHFPWDWLKFGVGIRGSLSQQQERKEGVVSGADSEDGRGESKGRKVDWTVS